MSIACGQEDDIQRLRNELLELREYVNKKMSRQLFMRDTMVANYRRMMEECDAYEKELEMIRGENARYEFVGRCLMNKVVELTGCKLPKRSTGSGKDDSEAALHLEVCSKKLLNELAKYKDRAEEASRNLDRARDQLAKALVTEDCLKRCADNLTVLAEADRTRRDCEEEELRTIVQRLTAELEDARCDADRLRTAVKEMSGVAAGCSPAPVVCSSEGLREDNFRLKAELKANFAALAALQDRVTQLDTALQQTCTSPLKDMQCIPRSCERTDGGVDQPSCS